MPKTDRVTNIGISLADEDQWEGIDSRFRLIIVAALRSKQLLHGSHPRIEADTPRHKNTYIALEETKQGLVPFTLVDKNQGKDGTRAEPENETI